MNIKNGDIFEVVGRKRKRVHVYPEECFIYGECANCPIADDYCTGASAIILKDKELFMTIDTNEVEAERHMLVLVRGRSAV